MCPTKLTDTPINHRILLNPCNVMNITSPCPRCRQQGLVVAMLSVGSWYAGTPCALILNREFVHPSSHIYNYSTPHSFQIFLLVFILWDHLILENMQTTQIFNLKMQPLLCLTHLQLISGHRFLLKVNFRTININQTNKSFR